MVRPEVAQQIMKYSQGRTEGMNQWKSAHAVSGGG